VTPTLAVAEENRKTGKPRAAFSFYIPCSQPGLYENVCLRVIKDRSCREQPRAIARDRTSRARRFQTPPFRISGLWLASAGPFIGSSWIAREHLPIQSDRGSRPNVKTLVYERAPRVLQNPGTDGGELLCLASRISVNLLRRVTE